MRGGAEWAFGLLVGAAGTWVMVFEPLIGLPIYVASALAVLYRTRSWAMAGAVLLATGLWFTYLHFQSIQRCAEMNARTASCTIVDSSGSAAAAMAFVFCGAVLSIYGLGKRSVRGGE